MLKIGGRGENEWLYTNGGIFEPKRLPAHCTTQTAQTTQTNYSSQRQNLPGYPHITLNDHNTMTTPTANQLLFIKHNKSRLVTMIVHV